MLPYLLAVVRLGRGSCDNRNHSQHCRVYRQYQKPDRKFAHAFLPAAKDRTCSGSTFLSLKFDFMSTAVAIAGHMDGTQPPMRSLGK
jgi:hypothetical protein